MKGDSVVLGIAPASPTSWDLGPRLGVDGTLNSMNGASLTSWDLGPRLCVGGTLKSMKGDSVVLGIAPASWDLGPRLGVDGTLKSMPRPGPRGVWVTWLRARLGSVRCFHSSLAGDTGLNV